MLPIQTRSWFIPSRSTDDQIIEAAEDLALALNERLNSSAGIPTMRKLLAQEIRETFKDFVNEFDARTDAASEQVNPSMRAPETDAGLLFMEMMTSAVRGNQWFGASRGLRWDPESKEWV